MAELKCLLTPKLGYWAFKSVSFLGSVDLKETEMESGYKSDAENILKVWG